MNNKPTPKQVMDMMISAFRTQVASSAEGRAIADAGLAKALDELIHSAAANAAQPVCWAFETEE